MSTPRLTLGPIVFREFEVPPAIQLGGRQRLAVHRLSSGRRVIDALGPDDSAITFSGVLSGSTASFRAHELDALRSIGQSLVLSWDSFVYQVVIESFDASFRNAWWIPYRISCAVLTNATTLLADTVLSPVTEALGSLDLLYASVPIALLPTDNIRVPLRALPRDKTNTKYLAQQAATLNTSVVVIDTKIRNTATHVPASTFNTSVSPDKFLTTVDELSSSASTLHYLSLAKDLLGQAAVYLEQAGAA